jgi:hypothetical protein
MGFEPTTFCMASSYSPHALGLKCLQIVGFRSQTPARRFNKCARNTGGLDTEGTPSARGPASGSHCDPAQAGEHVETLACPPHAARGTLGGSP